MKKKEQIENEKVFKERLEKGLEFLSSLSSKTIFDGVKKIVRQHVPESVHPSLDSCSLYRLVINENKTCEIYFFFGGLLNGYEVTLTAITLDITSRNPVHRPKVIYSCPTCDLINVITNE